MNSTFISSFERAARAYLNDINSGFLTLLNLKKSEEFDIDFDPDAYIEHPLFGITTANKLSSHFKKSIKEQFDNKFDSSDESQSIIFQICIHSYFGNLKMLQAIDEDNYEHSIEDEQLDEPEIQNDYETDSELDKSDDSTDDSSDFSSTDSSDDSSDFSSTDSSDDSSDDNSDSEVSDDEYKKYDQDNYYISKLENYDGMTCLHLTVMNKNNEQCVKFLLEQGARVNIPNSHGQNVLHIIALFRNYSYLEYCLRSFWVDESDLFVEDVNNKSFMDILLEDENLENIRNVIETLLYKLTFPKLKEVTTSNLKLQLEIFKYENELLTEQLNDILVSKDDLDNKLQSAEHTIGLLEKKVYCLKNKNIYEDSILYYVSKLYRQKYNTIDL